MKRPYIRKQGVSLIILLVGLLLFELFNYETSRIALDDMLGIFGTVLGTPLTLGMLLAGASWTIDIGGILRIFTPEQGMKKEPEWVRTAYLFWVAGSLLNTFLTWWVFELGMEQVSRMPAVLRGYELIIAIIGALLVWLIRFALVRNIGTLGDEFFHVSLPAVGGRLPKRTNRPKPDKNKSVLPPAFSGLQLGMRGGTGTSEPPFSEKKKGKKKKWSLAEFKEAVKINPRLKKMDISKLVETTGVSERTIYRWLEQV